MRESVVYRRNYVRESLGDIGKSRIQLNLSLKNTMPKIEASGDVRK